VAALSVDLEGRPDRQVPKDDQLSCSQMEAGIVDIGSFSPFA
jgi:hypothetical protein